jgi:eukaryotic-like serine/threonine-protein kinase
MSGKSHERDGGASRGHMDRPRPPADVRAPAPTRSGRASRYFHYWLESSLITKTMGPGGRPRSAEPFLPDVRADTLIGDTYRVVEMLGEGGMGMVVRAHDIKLQRDVAIKLIHPRCVTEAQARQRFLAEARVLARIRNPSVVEVYSFGEYREAPYFVMELVPGRSLDAWLAQCKGHPLAIDEAIGVLDQVCRGVSAMHRAGAVHHDLKPGNILIGPAFRVAVADLGLAWVVDAESDDARPVAGTPAYMAPEIAAAQHVSVDLAQRADIYSLGVIAFELLTGRLPFDTDDVLAVLWDHIATPPPVPSDLNPSLSPAFDQAILAALTKDPAQRTSSALELRDALLAARASMHAGFAGTRILIVDDDPAFAAWAWGVFEIELPGCETAIVRDGAAALAALAQRPAALVLTDLKMPVMNGVELTAALRGQEATRQVPIVVVTGFGGASDWKVLRTIGADGFLVKPAEPASLGALVRRLLGANTVSPATRPA